MTFSRPHGRGERRRLQIALSTAVLGLVALAVLFGTNAWAVPGSGSQVFINEFHYDNTGTDVDEFIEIAGPAGTDLSSFSLVLYNGNGGASYDTRPLSGTISNQDDGFGTVSVPYGSNVIQNGSPDGIALVQGSTVIQFLSYEGSFAATNGPANEQTSTNVGVAEAGTEPAGQSLQLRGNGDTFGDFTFAAPSDDSPGAVNTGQDFTATPPPVTVTRINQIQDSSQRSPSVGQPVTVEGVITAFRDFGFFMQEEKTASSNTDDDADPNTSEGIFVFTGSRSEPDNTFDAGDVVRVAGSVNEFRPGGAAGMENLSETQISTSSLSSVTRPQGNPVVDINTLETVIGSGGRQPPTRIIDDDTTAGDVETSSTFDPANDGIDFYESLEGMLTRVNRGVAVGPAGRDAVGRTPFGEIPVLADNGANATGTRTTKGGITIAEGSDPNTTRDDDFNPERVIFDDEVLKDRTGGFEIPRTAVGQTFPLLRGVISYSFGNFKAQLIADPPGPFTSPPREDVTRQPSSRELAVAEYSLENLSPEEDDTTFRGAANEIVQNLRSPDVIGLTEVQDNDGDQNSGVTDGRLTGGALTQAIRDIGGPSYQYREVDPQDDQDGGEPGGNIRVAFLIREDRGLDFVDRGNAGPTDETQVGPGPQLTLSPGRILDDTGSSGSDPAGDAFEDSRKPLVGEFTYRGQRLFVVQNHFTSKGEDTPLFGRFQPPRLLSEPQRRDQAQVVNNFVEKLLAANPNARVVVTGDLNDFEFSNPLADLRDNDLTNLIDGVAEREKYTFVFDGNSQVLDHMLISGGLRTRNSGFPSDFDVVHTTADFADRQSDHDPIVGFFELAPPPPPPPPANGGQPGRTINGNSGNNVLVGTPGNDVINCGSGDDRVDGRGGNDVINCGSGNDVVNGGAGNDRIHGDSGNDRLGGGPGNDTVFGDSGNDRISGGPGSDGLSGGTGRDSVSQD